MDINKTDSRRVNTICAVLLAIMIIVQLGIFVYYMAEKKQGYHMDELWSYGLSNSYYQPHMYTRFGIDEWDEYNHWNDGSLFREYLTVGEDERFEYGSVYYNQKNDVHPPLYYYILHTICSFFPGSFSPWYAFSINAVSFVAAQIFLYFCVVKISKNRFAGLAACAWWGFSTGAITCHIYLRMYALLIAFTLAYTYLTLKLIYDGFSKKNMALLCIVTYLGSLVQYFFIVYAGAMAACMCVYYLVKKQPKRMFAYGGFLLLSVGLAVLSFTPMLKHMLAENENMGLYASKTKHKTFALQLHFILRYMLDDISGIAINLIKKPIGNYILCVVVAAMAICLPLCFLFRNEVWFRRFVSRLKESSESALVYIRSKIGISLGVLIVLSVSVFSVFAINGLVSPIAYMKEESSHYSVQVYPVFIAVVMCFGFMLLRCVPKIGRRICVPAAFLMCIGCIVGSRLGGEVQYLFEYTQKYTKKIDEGLNAVTCGGDCIVAVNGGSEIQYYPWDLYNADSLFIMKYSELENCMPEFDEAGENGEKVYLVILEEAMLNGEYSDEMQEVFKSQFKDGSVSQEAQTLQNAYLNNPLLEVIKQNTRFENVEYIGSCYIHYRINHVYELF